MGALVFQWLENPQEEEKLNTHLALFYLHRNRTLQSITDLQTGDNRLNLVDYPLRSV